MNHLIGDLRYAIRHLGRVPGFTLTAILTLGLGIGATTTLFSVVHNVLLQALPYPDSDRIVRVFEVGTESRRASQMADFNFLDFSERSRSFEAMAQFQTLPAAVSGGDEPTRVTVGQVSKDFFKVMGTQPHRGRTFHPEEQQEGAGYVAVLSYGFWQRYLGGETDLSKKTLTYGDNVVSLIGVMPPEFDFPAGADFWIPRELEPPTTSRTSLNKRVIARLADGVPLERARQDVSAIAGQLKQEHGEDIWMVDAAVSPLHEETVGDTRAPILILFGASSLLLLIACANVFNLLLARVASRERELAVRTAMGVGRFRLFQQFLIEALLLSLGGGALGFLLARWGVGLLRGFEVSNLPRLAEVQVGGTVLLFVLGASTLVAVGLALLALWRAAKAGVRAALVISQRTQTSGGSARTRGALVIAQVALTLILLIGTGLLVRSFQLLLQTEPGYRTDGLLILNCQLPWPTSDEQAEVQGNFHERLISRLRAFPGIANVAGINFIPLKTQGPSGSYLMLNRPDEVMNFDDFRALYNTPGRSEYGQFRRVLPGYFKMMQIPLIQGRLLDERDHEEASHAAVVSETLAKTTWPGENPLGKLVQFGNMDGDLRPFTVVGVVGDIREESLESEPEAILYANSLQRTRALSGAYNILIEPEADASALINPVRKLVHEVDPQAAPSIQPLAQIFDESLAKRRFQFLLLSSFGVTALLLALVGIYGLVSFRVAQRKQEIGVRIALGARTDQVVWQVVKQGLILAAGGVVLGLAGAFGATRLMESLLYGVTTTDPITFLSVPLILIGIAVLASFLPAFRASRVDPVTALRSE